MGCLPLSLSARLLPCACLALIGCSSGNTPDRQGVATGSSGGTVSGGSGASSTSGGTSNAGSQPGAGGSTSPGAGGSTANPGRGGAAGTGLPPETGGTTTVIILPPTGGGGGGPAICNELSVMVTEVVPTVLLLVDTSSSMFEGTVPWKPLFDTLMDPTAGVVKGLQSKVRFGFSGYRSITQPTNDPECPKLTNVDFALDNYDAINAKYTALGAEWKQGMKWETPTGAAVKSVAQTLTAFSPMPPGPKYILLVTDGNPDTCVNRDPQCGQDESIKAVQDAKAAGIGTFAIGIGDILTNNAGCVGRCGTQHLQDLANAGAGLPVAPNSDEGNYQVCTGSPANVKGTYAAATETPGTATYYTATTGAQLKTAIQTLLSGVVSCTVDMNAIVTGNAAKGIVTVGGTAVAYNNPANGWKLEANNYQVTLTGTACTTYQGGGNPVHIQFPCEPDGTPIAVPR